MTNILSPECSISERAALSKKICKRTNKLFSSAAQIMSDYVNSLSDSDMQLFDEAFTITKSTILLSELTKALTSRVEKPTENNNNE